MQEGHLRKMKTSFIPGQPVQYRLPLDQLDVPLNDLVGQSLQLTWQGAIHCIHCGRATKKSFDQGYCFPCTRKLAQCDMCIVKPELCHYDQGTCREPSWGEEHCMIPHTVYLANSSGLKVGITRTHQQVTRWMDQGATQALPILRTKRRLDAGLLEVHIKKKVADKTNWRALLQKDAEQLDLKSHIQSLIGDLPPSVPHEVLQEDVVTLQYPIQQYPDKIVSFNFDKDPVVQGRLMGIKGQYLMLDSGVINIRKYAGYLCRFEF